MNNTCPACKSTNTQDASIRENNGIYGPGASSWVVEEKSLCNDCGVYFKPMAQSNEPTIEQMNEAIALFDGWQIIKGDQNIVCPSCDEGKVPSMFCICDQKVDRFTKEGKSVSNTYFGYRRSWDCLKPVIDKIFTYAIAYPDQVLPIRDMSIVVDIKPAHEKVYQFCKWLNQQNQKDGKEQRGNA